MSDDYTTFLALLFLSIGLSICIGAHSGAAVCILDIHSEPDGDSRMTLPGTGKPYGLVRFLQVNEETCVVDVTVQGLSPGQHGIHVHELGDISKGAASTGDHFNPTEVRHGDAETGHVGDLGNIEVDEKGWGDLVLESRRLKVWDIIGRSVVVTENEDRFGSSSTAQRSSSSSLKSASASSGKDDGGSGRGIICGIIARSAGVFENAKKVCLCDGTTIWEEESRMHRGAEQGNDFY